MFSDNYLTDKSINGMERQILTDLDKIAVAIPLYTHVRITHRLKGAFEPNRMALLHPVCGRMFSEVWSLGLFR